MRLAHCDKGLRLQLVKWPQSPSPLAREITAKWFSACVMKGHKVHLHLSLLWCFDVACAPSWFISRGDYIKPEISKTHTSLVCSGYGEQTQKSWAYFLTLSQLVEKTLWFGTTIWGGSHADGCCYCCCTAQKVPAMLQWKACGSDQVLCFRAWQCWAVHAMNLCILQ